VEITVKLL